MKPVLQFGVFTDAHFADKVQGDRYCRDSLAKLRACVEVLNARGLPMMFHLGDLVDKPEENACDTSQLDEMLAAWSGFGGERFAVLGNHDVETLTKAQFTARCGGFPSASPYYSFDRAGIHFVVLDGNAHEDGSDFCRGDFRWEDAWLAPEQITWLAADLERAAPTPALVFCHENLDPRQPNGVLEPHVLRNAAEARSVIESAGHVMAILQGHYHPGLRNAHNGVPYVSLTAMVVGEGQGNNAFAIVSVYEDGSLSVEGFGRQASWEGIRRVGCQREGKHETESELQEAF